MTPEALNRSVSILIVIYMLGIMSAWLPFPGPASANNCPHYMKFCTSSLTVHIAVTGEAPSPWIPNATACVVRDAAKRDGHSFWAED